MPERRLLLFVAAATAMLCVALVPVFSGLSAVTFGRQSIPTLLWLVLAVAIALVLLLGRTPPTSGPR